MTEEQVEYLNKELPRIENLERYKSDTLSQWVKHIITLLTGLLTILIAFKSNGTESVINHRLFSLTLILIGLSVSSGIVFLYSLIDRLNRIEKFSWESLNKRLSGDLHTLHTTVIKPRKIFVFFEYLFYIFSVSSLISLIIYGILKN